MFKIKSRFSTHYSLQAPITGIQKASVSGSMETKSVKDIRIYEEIILEFTCSRCKMQEQEGDRRRGALLGELAMIISLQ